MHKTISTDIYIFFLEKQQTDFGHLNASDSDARLLCVSVLSRLSPWESTKAQLQSSWGCTIHCPLLWSVNYLSNRCQTKNVRQPTFTYQSLITRVRRQPSAGTWTTDEQCLVHQTGQSAGEQLNGIVHYALFHITSSTINHHNVLGVYKLDPQLVKVLPLTRSSWQVAKHADWGLMAATLFSRLLFLKV